MYDVSLVNLAPDARSAAIDLPKINLPAISDEALRRILRNLGELDPVQNATADPEIRVTAATASYRIRGGQKKLILDNVTDRDAPAQMLTVDEVMAELDGSAAAARAAPLLAQAPAAVGTAGAPLPVAAPAPRPRRPRLIALAATAAVLAAALLALRLTADRGGPAAGFVPVAAAEAAALRGRLTGVYLTGTKPGQHGIVLNADGRLRLFELRAVAAPRVVYATGEFGRTGSALCLRTDQPGGIILIPNRDTLVYCGESYKRIP